MTLKLRTLPCFPVPTRDCLALSYLWIYQGSCLSTPKIPLDSLDDSFVFFASLGLDLHSQSTSVGPRFVLPHDAIEGTSIWIGYCWNVLDHPTPAIADVLRDSS